MELGACKKQKRNYYGSVDRPCKLISFVSVQNFHSIFLHGSNNGVDVKRTHTKEMYEAVEVQA